MNISDITEAKVARASDKKPKKIKPSSGHESPHPMQGKLVGESKPQKPKPYEPNKNQPNPVAKHSRNKSGAGAHKSPKDYSRKNKKSDINAQMNEGPLVLQGKHGVNGMIDRFIDTWKSKNPSEEEYADLMKVLGKHIEFQDGKRVVLTDLEEGNGNIRKAMGAAALIAALGLSMPSAKDTPLGKELSQAASAGDEVAAYHLKNMDLYVEANDQRTLVNLKIKYLEDSDRDDVEAYLAKKAGK